VLIPDKDRLSARFYNIQLFTPLQIHFQPNLNTNTERMSSLNDVAAVCWESMQAKFIVDGVNLFGAINECHGTYIKLYTLQTHEMIIRFIKKFTIILYYIYTYIRG